MHISLLPSYHRSRTECEILFGLWAEIFARPNATSAQQNSPTSVIFVVKGNTTLR